MPSFSSITPAKLIDAVRIYPDDRPSKGKTATNRRAAAAVAAVNIANTRTGQASTSAIPAYEEPAIVSSTLAPRSSNHSSAKDEMILGYTACSLTMTFATLVMEEVIFCAVMDVPDPFTLHASTRHWNWMRSRPKREYHINRSRLSPDSLTCVAAGTARSARPRG